MAERRSVELRQAFSWTCEDCGRDQFERAVTVEPESIDPDDLGEHRDWVLGLESGVLTAAPSSVACRHCGATFRTEEV